MSLSNTTPTRSQPFHLSPKPYLVLRDTLRSCEAFGMRCKYRKRHIRNGAANSNTTIV